MASITRLTRTSALASGRVTRTDRLRAFRTPFGQLTSPQPLGSKLLYSALQLRSSANYSVPPPKKRRFRSLLWLWRFTYLSMLGGLGAVSYAVYVSRHPPPQAPPDPSKKTLVILGTGWGSVSLLKNLDTSNYNVVVISPRNYFLFTPLLPSCTTGTIEHRSIMEPIRSILAHKKATVTFYEADASSIDPENKIIKISDDSEVKGLTTETEVPYDLLVIGVGAENSTFGIPGVKEHSCFLKEIGDAQQIRKKIMDCVETAVFKDQSPEEVDRLLHMVVVGGGPTGVEFAGELQDFFDEDIRKLVPHLGNRFKVTLVEALPNVLPSFSKQLIEYTESTFKEQAIDVLTKTMVKRVNDQSVEAVHTLPDGTKEDVILPYGLLVWATGNAMRPLVRDLISKIPAQKDSKRGLAVNEYLVVRGTQDIWALGDCAVAGYAPTAQVAAQEGNFLAKLLNNLAQADAIEEEIRRLDPVADASRLADLQRHLRRVQSKPFHYSHQGSLAYIGSEKAVADVTWWNGNIATGGSLTYFFWRSAYLSMCFSSKFIMFSRQQPLPTVKCSTCLTHHYNDLARNRLLVLNDWIKSKVFGRDISRE